MEKTNPQGVLHKKIGSTFYKVNIYFDNTNSESLEDKILRIIKNDLNIAQKNATIESLQTGWLSERSSQ